jgi:hypothetical protein
MNNRQDLVAFVNVCGTCGLGKRITLSKVVVYVHALGKRPYGLPNFSRPPNEQEGAVFFVELACLPIADAGRYWPGPGFFWLLNFTSPRAVLANVHDGRLSLVESVCLPQARSWW